MKQALYGYVYSEVVKDRDGYDCGHYYECYYLLFSEDGTVDCFESMNRSDTISSLPSPVARGCFKIEDRVLHLSLQRTDRTSGSNLVPTSLDTYGPREALDIKFTTGEHRLPLNNPSIKFHEFTYKLLDGDESLLFS